MKDLLKNHVKEKKVFVELLLKPEEWEELVVELIKMDTGLDLGGQVYSNYEDDTGFVMNIVNTYFVLDEELEGTEFFADLDEWYLTTSYLDNQTVFRMLFGKKVDEVDIYASGKADDVMYCLRMPLSLYEQL